MSRWSLVTEPVLLADFLIRYTEERREECSTYAFPPKESLILLAPEPVLPAKDGTLSIDGINGIL
jgi:hypothetical protein